MKKQHRKELFEMIKTGEGVPVNNLIDSVDNNIEVWNELNSFMENGIVDYNGPTNVKIINEYKQYLILKLSLMKYLIIDRNKGKSISKIELDKEYFIENLEEVPWGKIENYNLVKYKGDIPELLSFIENNRPILFSDSYITKRVQIRDNYGYLALNLKYGSLQLCFYSGKFADMDCLIIHKGDEFADVRERNRHIDDDMLEYYKSINLCKISEDLIPSYLKQNGKNKTLERVS